MKIRKVFLIIALLWMAMIFAFSSRNGDQSAGDSNWVGMEVGRTFVPGFRSWSEEEQQAFAEKIDHPIRKCAHAAEYMVLAMLWAAAIAAELPKRMMLAWGIGTLYAATDEIHQLFVPGRSGQITDVLLDSSGCLAGLLLAAMVILLFKGVGCGSRPW